MPTPRKYPEELRKRGVRLVFESGRPVAHVAAAASPTFEASGPRRASSQRIRLAGDSAEASDTAYGGRDVQRRDGVVGEVLADAGQVADDVDAVRAQVAVTQGALHMTRPNLS